MISIKMSKSRFLVVVIPVLTILALSLSASAWSASSSFKFPDTVRVGSYVMSIHDINFHDREYTIRFWVWMRYKYPDFHFDRRVEIPNAKSLEKPDTLIETQGKSTIVWLKMKAIMKEEWNVNHYPFDKETLNVQIENTNYGTDQLIFIQDSSGALFDRGDSIMVQGWQLDTVTTSIDTHVYHTNFGDTTADKTSGYSRYNIHLTIARQSSGLFFKLFLGMYLSFLIAILGFCVPIDEDIGPRFEIPIGALIAVVGNKYIIEPLLPEASAFTLVDILHIATLAGILLVIFVSTFSLFLHRKMNKKSLSRKIDFYGATLIFIVYALVNFVLIKQAYGAGM